MTTTTTASVPPHDLAAEESLLGAMLLNRDAITDALEVCTSDDFYSPTHRYIYDAITTLYAKGEPADPVTVADELRRTGVADVVGPPSILISLQANTPSPRNGALYAKIILEHSYLRHVMSCAEGLIEAGCRCDGDEVRRLCHSLAELPNASASEVLFRRWTMPELLSAPLELEWLVRGFAVQGTYGMTAGAEKTLKTIVTVLLMVAVASGRPLLGHFEVDKPRPVVAYVGEGGRIPYTRNLKRVAHAMGVVLKDLPIVASFDIAPIQTSVFQDTLRRDLADIKPGLVVVDPLYAFHGASTNAANVHEEAELLNALSGPCVDAGACLDVVNHYNKSGGRGLRSITMAGGREWCDSWWLLGHREEPDVEAGKFRLDLTIGSRQWGGTQWDLDLDLGRFDQDLNCHDGDITWEIRRANATSAKGPGTTRSETARKIVDTLCDRQWSMTKTELSRAIGGNRASFQSAFERLNAEGVIHSARLRRQEAATTKRRVLWGLSATPTNVDGPGSPEEAD